MQNYEKTLNYIAFSSFFFAKQIILLIFAPKQSLYF